MVSRVTIEVDVVASTPQETLSYKIDRPKGREHAS